MGLDYTGIVESQESRNGVGGEISADYIERLNYLESAGALDHLSELRKESRELDSLIIDAAGLFGLSEIGEMMSFVTSRILDRFIPTHLVFLIDKPEAGGVEAYSYRNMKPDTTPFPTYYFKAFCDFFKASPYAAPFAAVEDKIGAARFGTDLWGYEPDIIFPMLGIGGLFGVVLLGKKTVTGEYSNLEVMYVDRLLRFFAICIQNILNRDRSITDIKTGLFNHAYFMRRLDEEIARVTRKHAQSGLVMMDIDHFKHFNDTWGHLAGDEVLQALARTLKTTVRSEDVAARYGGEEFCVLLVDCSEERLFEVADRIRQKIAAMDVRFKDENLKVTVSLGCCNLDPSWKGNSASFIERADKALYRSKSAGRNRTTLYHFGLLGRASALRETGAPLLAAL